MRKNGFTLIELLAVIVILAIIALIATPIILGIINDAREKANERSVELYAAAVKNGIAAYQLREGKQVLPGTYNETNKLPFEVEYDGKVDCTNVIISEDGKVSLDGCTVNGGTKEYSYGEKEEKALAKACTIEKQDASKYSKGDVVTCELSGSTDKFYVIADAELSASTIQMLTEKNIHITEYRQSDNAGTTAFSLNNYWIFMIDDLEIVYQGEYSIITLYGDYRGEYGDYENKEGKQQNLVYPIVEGYVSYLNTRLTNAYGSLLKYSQAMDLGCDNSVGNCSGQELPIAMPSSNPAPDWVYSTSYWLGDGYGGANVNFIGSDGFFSSFSYNTNDVLGIRPVITISTSEIQ